MMGRLPASMLGDCRDLPDVRGSPKPRSQTAPLATLIVPSCARLGSVASLYQLGMVGFYPCLGICRELPHLLQQAAGLGVRYAAGEVVLAVVAL